MARLERGDASRSGLAASRSRGAATLSAAIPGWDARTLVRALDLIALVLLLGFGFWLRQRLLLGAPPFTDETDEVRRALQIARGEILPLDNVQGYISALNLYLTAAAFLALGTSMQVARGVTLVLGTLTIGLTYGLGRATWGSRLAGSIAAALVACSGAHVVVGSRVAWSNCTSPLYTTLAALLVTVGLRRKDSRLLLAASAAAGLAVLSHPATLPLLAGLGAVVLWQAWRGGWPKPAPLAGAVLVFLLVCSPLPIASLANGLKGLDDANAHVASYANGSPQGPAGYRRSLGLLGRGLAQVVGSEFEAEEPSLEYPAARIGAALVFAALGYTTWKRKPLLVLPVVLTALALPLLNPKYNLVMNGRYLMPLLPLLASGLGGLLGGALLSCAAAMRERGARRPRAYRLSLVASGLAAATVLGWATVTPLQRLDRYEQSVLDDDLNATLISTVERVEALREPNELVLLDARLQPEYDRRRPITIWRRPFTMRLLLELDGTQTRIVRLETPQDLVQALAWSRGETALVVAPVGVDPADPNAVSLAPGLAKLSQRELRVQVYRTSSQPPAVS